MKRIAMALVLGLGCLCPSTGRSAPAQDVVPRDLGFSGTFLHGGDDSFEFDLPSGHRVVLDRLGKLSAFQAGDADMAKDSAGRLQWARDGKGLLFKFAYNGEGQVLSFYSREGGSFHVAYNKAKKLVLIHFPNRQKGLFPPH
jgi:hypothetical protein